MPFNYKQPRNGYRARFLGYLRVSKDDETTGSHTFQTQELRIREHLDRACGTGNYDLELHRDDGISGALAMRPTPGQRKTRRTLQTLANEIATRQYDGLIVYSQSRLFRNPRGMMEFIEDVLQPNDTALLSATESLDISSADGRAMVGLIAIFDGIYRENVVKRIRDASATSKQFGYFVGHVPYGWDWVRRPSGEVKVPGHRNGIVFLDEYRPTLLLIKKRYESGWSCRKIAAELNTLRVPPPSQQARWKKRAANSPNAVWRASVVYQILAAPTHAGLIRDPRAAEEVEQVAAGSAAPASAPETSEAALWQRIALSGHRRGQHFEQRLWEPHEWEEIRATAKRRQTKFRTITARPNNPQLLAGIVCCARCGRRLYGQNTALSKGHFNYACMNGDGAGARTCRGLFVRGTWVEGAVVKELEHLAAQPQMRELIRHEAETLMKAQSSQSGAEARQLTGLLNDLDRKFERWADLLSDGTLSKEQFQQYNHTLAEQRRDLQARLSACQHSLRASQDAGDEARRVGEALEQIPLVWEHLDSDERRHLLFLLVEKVEVERDNRFIEMRIKVRLLPERVVTIPITKMQGRSPSQADPLTLLTRRELAILHLTAQGMTLDEMARHWGLRPKSVAEYAHNIRKSCGKRTLKEIELAVHDRIQSVLDYLPLEAKAESNTKANQSRFVNGEEVPFLSGVLMEVFPIFALGASLDDVAQRLNLSKTTVHGRRSKILKLMGTSSMLEAVEKAKRWEILP